MKARVIANPYNIGNGYYPVGQIVEIERETAHYYVLVKSSYRINKDKMALTGWAGRYAHTIEFEIIEQAPTVEADPVPMNTEILIATAGDEGDIFDRVEVVAVALGSLGPVSKRVDPISESVARVYAKLPVGVAVREALDLLYPLEFVITAYPLGAQDMIPDNPSPAVAGDLEREIRSGPAELEGESMPHAVVSVGSVWNARPVPPLELAGVINRVAACYSGVSMELGENLPGANRLMITWDSSPGEMVEREVRSAMLEALNKMAAALPACCLSLSVPNEWHGRPVDRDGLAAWCGRQGGGDFSLALNALPGDKLAIHWVTGPRPVAGLEAGILADARTWLNEGGTVNADEPAPVEPCRVSLAVPETWNGDTVPRDAVAAWCGTRSGQGMTLVLNPIPCASGGVVASWVSGAAPSSLDPAWQRKTEAAAVDFLNDLAEDVQPVERSGLRLAVPITWNGEQVDRDALAAWLERMGRQWPVSVSVHLGQATNRVDVGATLDHAGGPEAPALVVQDLLADVRAWLNAHTEAVRRA